MSNKNRNNRGGQATPPSQPEAPVVEAKDESTVAEAGTEEQSNDVLDPAVVDNVAEGDDVVAKSADEGDDEEPPVEDPNGTAARGETAVIAHVDELSFIPTGEPEADAADQSANTSEVLEFAQYSDFPTVGVEGKIYINQSEGTTYCWMEDIYVEIVSESEEELAVEKSPLQTLIDQIIERFSGLGVTAVADVSVIDPAPVAFDFHVVDGVLTFLVSREAALTLVIDGDEEATRLNGYMACAEFFGVFSTDPLDPPAPHVEPAVAEDTSVATAQAPETVAPEAETPAETKEEQSDPVDVAPEPVKELTLEEFYAPLKDESRNIDETAVAAFRERMVADRKAGLLDKETYVELVRLLASKVFKDVDRWQDSSLVRWAETGQEAGRIGKMLKHDRVRAKAVVERWTDEELIALIMRKIEPTFTVDIVSACREFVRRRGLNPLLTKEQVRVYLETEVLPKSVYHESDLFQLKPAYYWSDFEINEFIQGRLSTTKTVSATDIYDEYRRRHELTQSSFPDARIQGLQGTNETGVKVHMALKILAAELSAYAEKMAPAAAITEQGAGAMQTSLYRQMTRVLALDGQDFVTGWTEILDFVQAHKESHFTEARALRGLSSFQLGSRDRATFEQLMNLCIRTADPKVRYDAAKNINFGVVLAKISNEAIRHRVLAYYRVGQ